MRLDYKSIITKHYLLHLSGKDIADQIGASKSGVNGFLKAFEQAKGISYPLPLGITMHAWSGPYFIEKAMEVGPNTVALIKTVLSSKVLEVQTYRICVGILQYKDRYNGAVLEECCTRAMKANRPYYSYIKNTVAHVAEELNVEPCSKAEIKNTEPKKDGITRPAKASDLSTLLSKSRDLLEKGGDE